MTFASCTARAALLGAALAVAAAASAPGEGVSWFTDYAAARREAHDRNLPLVIDFSTDNCLYCRKLESVTFRDPAVVKLVKEHYVALHLHVGAGGAKEAAGLAQTLGVQGFPTLIFADPNGKVISRQDGFMEPAEFTRTAQLVLASLPPPTDPAVQQAVRLTAPSEDPSTNGERAKHAGRLLALAEADYRDQHFLSCLERCQALRTEYAELGEAAEARRMEDKIRTDPEVLRQACDNLTDRLGEMYLELADGFLRKEQPQKAALCLEWVMQACPGTPQAEAAKGRLAQIHERVSRPAEAAKGAP